MEGKPIKGFVKKVQKTCKNVWHAQMGMRLSNRGIVCSIHPSGKSPTEIEIIITTLMTCCEF